MVDRMSVVLQVLLCAMTSADVNVVSLDARDGHRGVASPGGKLKIYKAGNRQRLGDDQSPPVAASSMNQANEAFGELEKMTKSVATDPDENKDKFKAENGNDDTNIEDITANVSTDEKEKEVQEALQTWDSAWKLSEKPDGPEEGSLTQDIKNANVVKEKYQKVMMERKSRMSKQAAASDANLRTIHDAQVKQMNTKVALAKAQFHAAESESIATEAMVRKHAEDDMQDARIQLDKAKADVSKATVDTKQAVQKAAVAVERVRQHNIATHAAHASGDLEPVVIKVNDKLPSPPNETATDSDSPEAPREAPTTVVRAFKEIAVKNGLSISVKEVQSGKESPSAATAAVQEKMQQTAGSEEEEAQTQNSQIRTEQAALKEKLAAMSVKAALTGIGDMSKAVKENPP